MAKINTTNYQPVTAWNGTQDLFVVEQPDGTKVATPEQVKQFVLNDMDEVPTQDSDKPVKSGGVYTALALHDNTTVQNLSICKANNVVSIYSTLTSLDSTKTSIEYATLDEKYRPASTYAVGVLFSINAPYLPVGSVWVHGSTGLVSIYKEAALTAAYLFLTYLT